MTPAARRPWRALALLAVAVACSARNNGTLLVVAVDSDLGAPAIDEIQIAVRPQRGSAVNESFPVRPETRLPLRLALIPEGDPDLGLEVEARALLAQKPVVSLKATVRFVAGAQEEMTLFLARECASAARQQACAANGTECVPGGGCLPSGQVAPLRPLGTGDSDAAAGADGSAPTDASASDTTAPPDDAAPAPDRPAPDTTAPPDDAAPARDGPEPDTTAPPDDAAPAPDTSVPDTAMPALDAPPGFDVGVDQGTNQQPDASNGGGTWMLVSASAVANDVTLNGVWAASPTEVWLVGAQGMQGVAYFFDGMTWTPSPVPAGTPALAAVWALGGSRAWAVGANGTIVRHTANGWMSVPSGTMQALSGVWGTVGMDVWIVGQGKTVLHWNGSALEPVTAGLEGDLMKVTGVLADELWAVGPTGGIYRGSFNGWARQEHGLTQAPFYSVSARSSADVWAMGAGIALHFDGMTWTAHGGAASPPFGVYAAASDDVWAVGPMQGNGPLTHWNGQVWSAVTVPAMATLRSVHGSSAANVWAVGNLGTILRLQPR